MGWVFRSKRLTDTTPPSSLDAFGTPGPPTINAGPAKPAIPGTSENGPVILFGVLGIRFGLLAGIVTAAVVEHGFHVTPMPVWAIHGIQILLIVLYGWDAWLGPRKKSTCLRDVQLDWVDGLIQGLAGVGLVLSGIGLYPWGWRLIEVASVLLLVIELWRLQVGLSRSFNRPGALLPMSFLAMIAVGTGLLKIPVAVPAGQDISWLDAVFTMTSAVCVTGLIVRDTATQFTPFGQVVIGVFIQLGGLGIVVFGSVLAMMLGRQRSLREDLTLRGMLHDLPLRKVTSYVRFVVLMTIVIEVMGAAIMACLWPGELSISRRLGMSLFHAVSAFCNAGFALQTDSLESFRYNWLTYMVIAPLIVIGGIGFPVLDDLWLAIRNKWRRHRRMRQRGFLLRDTVLERRHRLRLHTKLVLVTTASLYLFGVVILAVGQLKLDINPSHQPVMAANTGHQPSLTLARVGGMVADAGFMSISARTAGFNSMPMDEISPAGRFTIASLMMIGASPGGTGGGMKTATLALLLLTIVATVRNRTETEAFGRGIHEELIRKAATVAAAFLALVGMTTLCLTLSEPYPFEKIFFEAISAASTTGLSLGITSELTAFGKITIIVAMFLGRIGPLTLVGALMFTSPQRKAYAYAHESVVLG